MHPGFLVFTAFVGANLAQSAVTKWCPMMWLLNRAGLRPTERAAIGWGDSIRAFDDSKVLAASAGEALRSGTIAGLAMIPFGALFQSLGLRVNEYGRKTLRLLVGDVPPALHSLLTFALHLLISWIAPLPLLLILGRFADLRVRVLIGLLYGAAFYGIVNSLALPIAFGDPTPWELGFATVYPSLVVHLVYGTVVARTAKSVRISAIHGGR